MENRRPSPVERRLAQIRAEGIEVNANIGTLDGKKEATDGILYRFFNFGENPELFKLSERGTEFIAREVRIRKDEYSHGGLRDLSSLCKTVEYGFKQGIMKETDAYLYLEFHAIYESNRNMTYYFVLPSRRYLEEKPQIETEEVLLKQPGNREEKLDEILGKPKEPEQPKKEYQ